MSSQPLIARVRLGNRLVGAIAEVNGQRLFEYASEYLAGGGPSISPVHLPAQPGVFSFPHLMRVDAFKGLPGVFADSLPDRFGDRLQKIFFARHGILPDQLSPVQQLLYVGERGMGALTFEPAEPRDAPYQLPLELAELRRQAKAAIEGETSKVLTEIMEAGSSAGGMRAKVLVGWNRTDNTMVANMPELPPGYEPWLIKLDGVDNDGKPGQFGRLEYAYHKMARAAGISMSTCLLIAEGGAHHFATRRFDRYAVPSARPGDSHRLHYHSLAGLQHVDFNTPLLASYDLYFASVRMLGLGADQLSEAYRRMVFNVVVRNQDDHPKNFGFLMQDDGQWALAPAFDLTWAHGSGYTARHQMLVNDKAEDLDRSDLLAVGEEQGVRNPGEIIDQVIDAAGQWSRFAADAGLPKEWTDRIQQDLLLDACGHIVHPPGP
ncbi:MAG: type II toxin-antitoxin system HipA family toxin [Rhodanobacter sp.]